MEINVAPPGADHRELGHIVAADPRARFLAVTAFQLRIRIFRITPRLPSPSSPSSDQECPIQINVAASISLSSPSLADAVILQSAFLTPPPSSPDSVFLATSLCAERSACVIIHQWSSSESSPYCNPRQTGSFQLDPSDMPLHLVPLPNLPAHFLVITESKFILVSAFDPRRPTTSSCVARFSRPIPGPLHSQTIPQHLADLGGLISAAAVVHQQPPTAPAIQQSLISTTPSTIAHHEHLYFASDQGDVYYARISSDGKEMHVEHVYSLRAPLYSIAIPFASPTNHIVALFGSTCDGEIIDIDLRSVSVVNCTQARIPNAPPVVDFCVHDLHGQGVDSIFMTSGCSPYGSICQVRHGIGVTTDTLATDLDGLLAAWGLAASSNDTCDTLLVLSFVGATRVLFKRGGDLEDISDASGLVTDVSTIAVSAIHSSPASSSNLIVQVHTHGILASLPAVADLIRGQDSPALTWSWSPKNDQHIIMAAIHDNLTIAALSGAHELHMIRVLTDAVRQSASITPICTIPLSAEPSCLYCTPKSLNSAVQHDPSQPQRPPMCIVGTYDSGIIVFAVGDNTMTEVARLSLGAYSNEPINPPHSIELLESEPGAPNAHLLVGLRDGTLLDFEVTWNDCQSSHAQPFSGSLIPMLDNSHNRVITPFIKKPPVVLQLGKTPLALASCRSLFGRTKTPHVLALSETTWRVSLSPLGGVRLEPLLHDGPISHTAPFAFDEASDDGFLSVSGSVLQLLRVESTSRHHTRSLHIGDTPRRVVFDPLTKLLVVASVSWRGGKDVSALKVIDPNTGIILREETDTFEPNETVHALTVWYVKPEKRYICVGTRMADQSGRILVFSIRSYDRKDARGHNKVRLAKLGECRLRAAVTSLCSYTRSYLFAASGTMLYQTKIESTSRSVVTDAAIDTRSIISSIRVAGTRVFVSNASDSVSVYEFVVPAIPPQTESLDPSVPPPRAPPKFFEYRRSDSDVRVGADCVPVSDTLAVCSDRSGCVFALSYTDDPHHQTMSTLFSFEMYEPVLQLHAGSLAHRASRWVVQPTRKRMDRSRVSNGDGDESRFSSVDAFRTDVDINELTDLDLGWWLPMSSASPSTSDPVLDDHLDDALLLLDGHDGGAHAGGMVGGTGMVSSDTTGSSLAMMDTNPTPSPSDHAEAPWQPTSIRDITFLPGTLDKRPPEPPETIPRRQPGGQIVYGTTLSGTLIAIMRLKPDIYIALALLQHVMATSPYTRPLLGNDFYRYRLRGAKCASAIDASMVLQYLTIPTPIRVSILATWNDCRVRHLVADEQRGLCSRPLTIEMLDQLLIWIQHYCV